MTSSILQLVLIVVPVFVAAVPDEIIKNAWIGLPEDGIVYATVYHPGSPAYTIHTHRMLPNQAVSLLIEFADVTGLTSLDGGTVTSPGWLTYLKIYAEEIQGYPFFQPANSMLFFRGFYYGRPVVMIGGRATQLSSPITVTYDPPPTMNATRFSHLFGYDKVTGNIRPIRPFSIRVEPRHPHIVTSGYFRSQRFSVLFSTPVRACNLTANGDYAIDIGFLNIGQPSHGSGFRSRCVSPTMRSFSDESTTSFSRMWYCNLTSSTSSLPAMDFPELTTDPTYFPVCDAEGRVLQRWVVTSTTNAATCAETQGAHVLYATDPTDFERSEYYAIWHANMPMSISFYSDNWPGFKRRLYDDDDFRVWFNFTSQMRQLSSSAATLDHLSGLQYNDSRYGCSMFTGSSVTTFPTFIGKGYTVDLFSGNATFSAKFGTFTTAAEVLTTPKREDFLVCFEYDQELTLSNKTSTDSFNLSARIDLTALNTMYNVTCTLAPVHPLVAPLTLGYWRVPYTFPVSTLAVTGVIAHYQDRFIWLSTSDILWARSIDKWQIRDGCNRTAKAANASNNLISIELESGCSNFSVSMSPRAVHSYVSGFVGYSTQLSFFSEQNVTLSVAIDCSVRSTTSLSFSPSIASPSILWFNCTDGLTPVPVSSWTFDATPVHGCMLDFRVNGIYSVYRDNHPMPLTISDHCTAPYNATCSIATGEMLISFDPVFNGDTLVFSCPSDLEAVQPYSNGRVSIIGLFQCVLNFTLNDIFSVPPLAVSDVCPLIINSSFSQYSSGGSQTGDLSPGQVIIVYGENRTVYVNGTEYIYGANQTLLVRSGANYFDLPLLQMIGVPVMFAIVFFLLGVVICSCHRHPSHGSYSSVPISSPVELSPRNAVTTVNVYASGTSSSTVIPFASDGIPVVPPVASAPPLIPFGNNGPL